MLRSMRKGFTLVELLIVIVIIGILAAAMLLSSGSATATAEASNIISGMRSLQAAAMLFYFDNKDDSRLFDANQGIGGPLAVNSGANFTGVPAPAIAHWDQLLAQMANPGNMDRFGLNIHADDGWWITYRFLGTVPIDVSRRLAARSTAAGLFSAPILRADLVTIQGNYSQGDQEIWTPVR